MAHAGYEFDSDQVLPQTKARMLVFNYMNGEVPSEEIFVTWYCKTLQNWKALVTTTLPDSSYYEVTYNGDKRETYIDEYKKINNVAVPD